MSTVTAIKDILDAISSVKSRAKHSMAMGDLFALENCLVTETTKLMEEMEPVRLVA